MNQWEHVKDFPSTWTYSPSVWVLGIYEIKSLETFNVVLPYGESPYTYNKQVLSLVSKWIRPFCTVVWMVVTITKKRNIE
jgi:hypothetical protein